MPHMGGAKGWSLKASPWVGYISNLRSVLVLYPEYIIVPVWTTEIHDRTILTRQQPPMSHARNSRVTLEQEVYLYSRCPQYHKAVREGTLSEFWTAVWNFWFLNWPVVPGLIERGLLPPEAANYKFTPAQEAVVNAAMDPIMDVSPSRIHDPVNNLSPWCYR